MSIESRFGLPSKKRAMKVASTTLIISLPIAGFLVRREFSSRRIKNELSRNLDVKRNESTRITEDSINSGDSGFIFLKE